MQKSFTLRFEPGSEPEISGTREELAVELENLAGYIRSLEDDDDSRTYISLRDGYCPNAYMTAVIEPRQEGPGAPPEEILRDPRTNDPIRLFLRSTAGSMVNPGRAVRRERRNEL